MAGFLDSDFAKIVLGTTPYMRQRLRQEEEAQRQARYMDVAYETGQLMRPGEAGPPVAYASPTGISPEFATRVAGMPGYQQLGANLLDTIGRGGMAREAREWSRTNLTAEQAANLDQRQEEFKAAEKRRDYEYRNLSEEQRQRLGLLQAQGQEANRRFDMEMGMKYPPAGAGRFPMPGSKEFDDQYQTLQGFAGAVKDVGTLQDTWNSTPWGFDRAAMGRGDVLKQNIIGMLGRMQNTGALNEGDVKRFSEVLNEPGVLSLSSRRNAALNELRQVLITRMEETQARNPYLPRAQVPEGFTPVQPAQLPGPMQARPTYYGGRGGSR